jgi:hypothetical protein
VLVDREKRQKPRDFGDAHLARMRLAVEEDVAADPVDVGLFGPPAVMPGTNRLTHAVEQLGALCLHATTMPSSPPERQEEEGDPRLREVRLTTPAKATVVRGSFSEGGSRTRRTKRGGVRKKGRT